MVKRDSWRTVAAHRVRQIAGLKDIDRAVTKIAEELMDGLVFPPTNLDALAELMGIAEIRYDDSMLVAGELRKMQGELVVYLLPNLTKTRRRFTLAHELGHAFFETTGRRPHPSRELEWLCNKFAAEFLMPRRTFELHAGPRPNLDRVHELCQTFETGLLSTLGRVSDIYEYRAIELLDRDVVWSRRLSVRGTHQISDRLQAQSDRVGNELVDLYEGQGYSRWNLEWKTLSREHHKIGLLHPVSNGIWRRRAVSENYGPQLSG